MQANTGARMGLCSTVLNQQPDFFSKLGTGALHFRISSPGSRSTLLCTSAKLPHLTPTATSLKLIVWGTCIKNLDFAVSSSSGSG
jgi:hypothetical protein